MIATPAVVPGEPKAHLLAVADVLLELAEDIEMMGEALCRDGEVVGRHLPKLQAIDLIAQKQRSLAALLRADCPVSALAEIGMEELKVRLTGLMECDPL